MMGKQHLQFAVITSAIGCAYLGNSINGLEIPILSVITAGLGSLLPDIDSPVSRMGKYFPLPSKIINGLFGHRTITHDIFWCGIAAVLLYLKFPMTIAISYGYLSHLFLDAFTCDGICWGTGISKLFGIKNNRFYILPKRLRIISGGIMSTFVTWAGIICTTCIFALVP